MSEDVAATSLKPWDTLYDPEGDTGTSYVLPDPPPMVADLLAYMVEDQYGERADEVPRDHPEFVSCLSGVHIETWRQFSDAAAEDYGTEPGWWGADGDSAHSIVVAWFDGDIYDLGISIFEAGSGRSER